MATTISFLPVSPERKAMIKRSTEWLLPVLGLLFFIIVWHFSALQVKTSLGTLPGPVQTAEQFVLLIEDHADEGKKSRLFMNDKKHEMLKSWKRTQRLTSVFVNTQVKPPFLIKLEPV